MSPEQVARLQALVGEPDLAGTRYELRGALGSGGMGVVYRAWDSALRREVALKVLLDDDVAGLWTERLTREARTLAALEHPGIVAVHDLGELPDGRPFYVMKRVQGDRLDRWLASGPPLVARLRLFERVCEAVGFAHGLGVVHRDLKPANVMVGSFGEALVLDWGGGGTVGYQAPEQVDGGEVGPPADVHALGRMLRELVGTDGSRPLTSIVAKATAPDPADRYPDAAALGAEVRRLVDGDPAEAHTETLGEQLVRVLRRHQVLVGLIAAYLVMRVLVALLR